MISSKSNYQHCTNSFRDKRPQKGIYKYNASLHGPWTFYRVKWVLLSFGYMPWYYILILCDAECHRSSLSPLSILNLTPRSADCYRSYIVLLEWGTHWVNSQPQACSSTSIPLVNGKNLLVTNIIVSRKQFIFLCLCVFEFLFQIFPSLPHTHIKYVSIFSFYGKNHSGVCKYENDIALYSVLYGFRRNCIEEILQSFCMYIRTWS